MSPLNLSPKNGVLLSRQEIPVINFPIVDRKDYLLLFQECYGFAFVVVVVLSRRVIRQTLVTALDLEPPIKPQNNMEVITSKFPTEREIQEIEHRLEEMRARREEAKQLILQAFKSGEVVNALSPSETMALLKQLQAKLHGARKKTRGSPVSTDLRKNLESALKENRHTLSQLEKMFGLSVSYISRIKQEMRHRGELPPIDGVLNAYGDRQQEQGKQVAA